MPDAATALEARTTSPAQLPRSSLIICSRNRPQLLADTVESILKGTKVPTELVLIDQSTDLDPHLPSLTTERPCEIRHIPTRSVGLGRARNAGLDAARYEVLAYTDDDMLAVPGWYESLMRSLVAGGPKTVVTGQVLPAEEETPGGFVPSTKLDNTPAVYEGRVDADVLFMGNMAMYRSAADEIGRFDDRLGAGGRFAGAEDNDYGFRLLEAGYRIAYVPEAILYHRAWRPASDLPRLNWAYGRGQGAFYAKHLSLSDRYILRLMVRRIASVSFRAVRRLRRERPLAYADAMYVRGLFSGAGEWLLTQRRTR